MSELEYRQAEQVGVSFPDRTIELIVMPYNTETVVPVQGRMVRETVDPGAFDGIERRANRVRVNRDHRDDRVVGRAVALHPSRQEGLVAELRIAKTDLGDETLALADEGCLDASAGFLPMPGGEQWEEGRTLRRLTRLWLGHIAMTPDPAYETANVLAVRTADSPSPGTAAPDPVSRPNLDQLAAERLQALYADLDRRYCLNR